MHSLDNSYLESGVEGVGLGEKLGENVVWTGVADGIPLNWNGAVLVGAVDPEPKLNEGVPLNAADPPNAKVDGLAPNVGGGAAAAAAAVGVDENAKPLVVPDGAADVWIELVVIFEVPPKLNDDGVLVVEPKPENDGTEVGNLSPAVGAAPNVAVAPNAGVGVVLLVEITEGANGFSGLPAPNANGVLLDVVVVVLADGKLKPDADDKLLLPNRGTADVVVAVGTDDDTNGKLLGNENPLVVDAGAVVVEATGKVKVEAIVVAGAVAFDGKPNKLGVIDEVVVGAAAAVDNGVTGKVEGLAPNANEGSLSDETVEAIVVAAVVVGVNDVPPNEPKLIDVGTFIGDVVVLVIAIEGTADVLVAVVVFVDANEPNDWNVEGVGVLNWKRLFGVLVTDLSKVAAAVVVVPNRGAVVEPNEGVVIEGNEALVVTDGLITIFSLVVVGVVPNDGNVLGVVNGVVAVTSGGIEKVLSLVVVVVGGDVTIDVNVLVTVVTALGIVGSSIIISGVLFDDMDGVGSIARKKKQQKK